MWGTKYDIDNASADLTSPIWRESILEATPQFILQLMIILRTPLIVGNLISISPFIVFESV